MNAAGTARATWAARLVREQCFGAPAAGRPTFGAEIEFIALDATTRAVAPIFPRNDDASTLDVVRQAGRELGWDERVSDKGVPKFVGQRGGSLTFEPGGQLEYASAVHGGLDGLVRELDAVEALLVARARDAGIELLARGVDPCNAAEGAPLQLTAGRYAKMAGYFASIGPDGARMMRQTASLQVNIGGISVLDRWETANAIAPLLIALFANSARYARADTGCASYRAETWRGVDPLRTGVFCGNDAVAEYTQFALDAPAFLADADARPFGAIADAEATELAFAAHLTTLFPEVRPRGGYLEFRSIDAVDAPRRTAALALVAAVMCDPALQASLPMQLPVATEDALRAAGRRGLRDAAIRAQAETLAGLAAGALARLPASVASEDLKERALPELCRLA